MFYLNYSRRDAFFTVAAEDAQNCCMSYNIQIKEKKNKQRKIRTSTNVDVRVPGTAVIIRGKRQFIPLKKLTN